MKASKQFRTLAGLALTGLAAPALAQIQCGDIEYGPSVVEQFPEIEQACREVVSRDGRNYVMIRADVASVRRNVRDSSDVQQVTLRLLDAEDETLRLFGFRPPRGFTYLVEGEKKTADAMGRGQELRIYIPSDRWELVWDIDSAQPIAERIKIEEIESLAQIRVLEADDAFAFDSAELTESGMEQLDEILEAAGEYVPMVDITGYTDRIGAEAYNQELSESRAQAAKAYLVSQGVPEGRIRAVGKGAADPIVACPDLQGDALKECLAPNRRAEIRFMVPLVAEGGRAVVERTYRRPDGEIINVTSYQDALVVNPAASSFGKVIDACREDAQQYCTEAEIGAGQMAMCLYENTPLLSEGCATALSDASLLTARRQQQLNVIGDVCSTDLAAHCADVPLVDKLACLRESDLTDSCASAVRVFEGLSY